MVYNLGFIFVHAQMVFNRTDNCAPEFPDT